MPTVYIETTIPSFYFETRKSAFAIAWRAATREWWDNHRRRYDLHTSRFVVEELSLAPREKSKKALGLIQNVDRLDEPAEIARIVRYYIDHRLMPSEAGGDAFHLALASLHSMDFLLTWNCQHLANANKIRHMRVLNTRLGLHVPVITTPFTLM
jgi:hypothetical protein